MPANMHLNGSATHCKSDPINCQEITHETHPMHMAGPLGDGKQYIVGIWIHNTSSLAPFLLAIGCQVLIFMCSRLNLE